MNFLVTGATGLLGSLLTKKLLRDGHKVFALTRRSPDDSDLPTHDALTWLSWRPEEPLDLEPTIAIDGVFHLAGETVAHRWTEETKAKILSSRVESTKQLIRSLRVLPSKPKKVIFASAVGIYGFDSPEVKSEASTSGTGFLASVVSAWEEEMKKCDFADCIAIRLGIVLSTKGGALSKILTPFKLGLGGPIGSGENFMSWIHIEDAVDLMLYYAYESKTSSVTSSVGFKVVNAVAPNPVSNKVFSQTLANELHRPCVATVPPFALKFALGEMAVETALSNLCVKPDRALADGFQFRYAEIQSALKDLIQHHN